MIGKSTKKVKESSPWFKKPWGIIVAAVFFPFFILWYVWAVSKISTFAKLGLSLGALLMILVYSSFIFPSKTELKEIRVKSKTSYALEYKDDATLEKGQLKTVQEGVEGEIMTTFRVEYVNGVEQNRIKINEEIITSPITKVVLKGTKETGSNQEPSAQKGSTEPTTTNDVYYANCTEARNAGAAPIYAGSPGYRSALDRDADGIACE